TSVSSGQYVYVMGGSNATAQYLNDLWRWDSGPQTWTQLANMPTGKSNAQAALWNGKIYLPGGYIGSHITENAIYDIASNTWTTGAPLPATQSGMTAAYNGKIYVFGGNPGPQSIIRVYDIATNTWSTSSASLPVATTYGRAITVGNYIYVIGGITTTVSNAVYRFDPVANTIATMTPLQTARTWEELMSDGTNIYAVAGGDATYFTGVPLAQSVEIYSIAGNSWTYGNPVVAKASSVAGGLAGGKFMIQGGVDNTVYYDLVQVSVGGSGGGCPTSTPAVTNTIVVPTATVCVPSGVNVASVQHPVVVDGGVKPTNQNNNGSTGSTGSTKQQTGKIQASTGARNPNKSGSPAAPAAPFVTLYDQYNNDAGVGTSSQDFEPGFDNFDDQVGDDFVIPAATTWTINEVDLAGQYFNGAGPAASMNVYFYANGGTLPAAAVYTATNLAYTNTAGNFVVPLTVPAVLTSGTYWVSVQARMDFSPNGQFAWNDRSVQSNSGAAFRNAGGGFACSGGNGWVLKTTCVSTTAPDQVYRLVGTVGGGGGCPTVTPGATNTPGATPTCAAGGITEGFESGTLGAFTNVVPICTPGGCNWTSVASNPHSGTRSAFAPDGSDISDQYLELTNAIVPSAGNTLTFWHSYDTEPTFDGGVLEATTNNGATWTDMEPNITTGGYDGPISVNFGSPIAGRNAWNGSHTGYSQVSVNLTPYAGQSLRIRFRLATDNSVGAVGWNIDDIVIGGGCVGTSTPVATNTPGATPTCVAGVGAWTAGADLPTTLTRAYGAYFPTNGKFYALGGRTGDGDPTLAQRNPLEYNPGTNTWTQKTAQFADQFTSNVSGGLLTVSGTPVIILVGGSEGGGATGTTETRYYDPVADTMTTVATDPWTPGSTTLTGGTAVFNNKLYVLGGFVIGTGMSNQIWEYDPARAAGSRWLLKTAVLPTALGYIPAATVGSFIYTIGGSEWDGSTLIDSAVAYKYDPTADTIVAIASTPR
ncbi:MAG: kelch repeat-containing protein, partial [Chloroflexia bacterium]